MTYGKIKVDKIQSSAEELTLPTSAGTSGQVLTSNGSGVLSFADNATGTDLTTTADGTSLTVESSSGNNVALPAATSSAWGVMSDEDKAKLDAIEASATADQTGAEIKTAYEGESDTNAFTDADHTKLDGIETSATADQTNAEIRAAVEAATDSNVFTDADHTKLNGIATSANNYAISADLLDEDDLASDSATKAASQQSIKAYVDTEVAGLVNSAPSTLDTLDELADALGDDANYAATVTTSLGLKAPLASPAFTGDATLAGDLTVNTDALFVDASAKNVSIGKASPTDSNSFSRALDISGPSGSAVYVRTNESATNYGLVGHYGTAFYLRNQADGPIYFSTDATTKMVLDSSGSLLIGGTLPSSPATTITAAGAATFAGNIVSGTFTSGNDYSILLPGEIRSYKDATTSDRVWEGGYGSTTTSWISATGDATFAGGNVDLASYGALSIKRTDGHNYALIRWGTDATYAGGGIYPDGSATFTGNSQFGTGVPGGSATYGVLIGSAGSIQAQAASGNVWIGRAGSNGAATSTIGENGDIWGAGDITAGGTISDIRFKENITDAKSQLDDVVALGSQLKNWDWKTEAPVSEKIKSRRFLGIIAQEAEKVCPEVSYSVSRTKDGAELTPESTDEEGNVTPATYEELDDSFKAIKHDVLLMKLLGAVAELSAKVAALEAA